MKLLGWLLLNVYSLGKPVIASNIGVMGEMIKDGKTGLLFEPGNSQDLASKAEWLWDHTR